RIAARSQAGAREHLLDPGQETVGGVARGRRRLGGDQLARLFVEGDDVGERSARVDADSDSALLGHVVSLSVIAALCASHSTLPCRLYAMADIAGGSAIHCLYLPASPSGSIVVSTGFAGIAHGFARSVSAVEVCQVRVVRGQLIGLLLAAKLPAGLIE